MAGELKLSESQQRTLTEFKLRIADVMKTDHDDFYLTKWLKARCFNLANAEKMYRESLAYREKMKVDSMATTYTPPKVLAEYFPGGYCGYDRDGSPLCVELFGRYDMKGLMLSTRRSDLERLKLFQCEMVTEECKRQSEKLGKRVDGISVIFDMENVGTKSLWRPGLEMYLHLIKVLEDNYPEMAKRLIIVNAPAIFPFMYRLARHLLSEDMKKKIFVLGSNYKTELLKFVDADQLPAYLGGTLTDPDGNPRCTTMIHQGGPVPQSFYLTDHLTNESMNVAVIPSGETLSLDFEVEKPCTMLKWEFRTENYDIGFGVNLTSESGKRREIVPSRKYNSHLVAEDDSIVCSTPGTYSVIFDNSFSWTKSKKVFYLIELVDVDDQIRREVQEFRDVTQF